MGPPLFLPLLAYKLLRLCLIAYVMPTNPYLVDFTTIFEIVSRKLMHCRYINNEQRTDFIKCKPLVKMRELFTYMNFVGNIWLKTFSDY